MSSGILAVCLLIVLSSHLATTGDPSLEASNNPLLGRLPLNPLGPLLKSVGRRFDSERENKNATEERSITDILGSFIPNLAEQWIPTPSTTTTTTTTTTAHPLVQLTDNLTKSSTGKAIMDGQTAALNTMVKGASGIDQMTGGFLRSTNQMMQTFSGGLKQAPEDKSWFVLPPVYDIQQYREPKYFSRDCNFRVACEVGKLLRPLGISLKEILETNKLINDLQNRYTRSITYGMLYNDCSKYYCLLIQFAGGPTAFAKAVMELLNRIANPDMYEA